jgi:hypothetical protein
MSRSYPKPAGGSKSAAAAPGRDERPGGMGDPFEAPHYNSLVSSSGWLSIG